MSFDISADYSVSALVVGQRRTIFRGSNPHVCAEMSTCLFWMVLQKAAQKTESLGDALPLIITRLCEPKEASYNLIKKYLEQHFPGLNIENK